jgi:hypothetical protein
MLDGKLNVINERGLSFMINWIIPFMSRARKLKMVRAMQEKQA